MAAMTVLPGAGRGDQQVAVVALLAGQCDLFEQPLLKRFQAAARSGSERRVGPCAFRRVRAREELLALVGNEVAVVPVALEDRGDLVDHVRVARTRHADIPFEPANLRRVGEVRRADVGRREARVAVKQPRLRVQAGRAGVV